MQYARAVTAEPEGEPLDDEGRGNIATTQIVENEPEINDPAPDLRVAVEINSPFGKCTNQRLGRQSIVCGVADGNVHVESRVILSREDGDERIDGFLDRIHGVRRNCGEIRNMSQFTRDGPKHRSVATAARRIRGCLHFVDAP